MNILCSALWIIVAACQAQVTREPARFVTLDAGVVDHQTGLMWALHDNGDSLDWFAAQRYCVAYTAGGHADWRLPTGVELQRLYAAKPNEQGYRLTDLIRLTGASLWSADELLDAAKYRPPGAAVYVDFSDAYYAGQTMVAFKAREAEAFSKVWPQLRVLPVRTAVGATGHDP